MKRAPLALKRGVALTLSASVAGACATTLLAWGCARWSSAPRLSGTSGTRSHPVEWPCPVPSGAPAYAIARTTTSGFGKQTDMWASGPLNASRLFSYARMKAGWPLKALACEQSLVERSSRQFWSAQGRPTRCDQAGRGSPFVRSRRPSHSADSAWLCHRFVGVRNSVLGPLRQPSMDSSRGEEVP